MPTIKPTGRGRRAAVALFVLALGLGIAYGFRLLFDPWNPNRGHHTATHTDTHTRYLKADVNDAWVVFEQRRQLHPAAVADRVVTKVHTCHAGVVLGGNTRKEAPPGGSNAGCVTKVHTCHAGVVLGGNTCKDGPPGGSKAR